MTNKKVKNATAREYNGIKFKSQLEVTVYKTLLEQGFNPLYEPKTFIVWKGFKPNVPYYTKDKGTKALTSNSKKIIDIKYTPDFYIRYGNYDIYIEAKGKENDVFYIKRKLFRKFLEEGLEEHNIKTMYFEIYTKKQLLQAIEIIKSCKPLTKLEN